MVVKQGIPASLVIVFAVLWLLWRPVVVVVALVQKRTIGLAILFGMLLGPFGFYFFPRLPPRKPRTPGWYPYWYPNHLLVPQSLSARYWDGQTWTDERSTRATRPTTSATSTSPDRWGDVAA